MMFSGINMYETTLEDGRTIIPAAIIDYLHLTEGAPITFVLDENKRTVEIERGLLRCKFCGRPSKLGVVGGEFICESCVDLITKHPPEVYA